MSSPRADGTLGDALAAAGVLGIEGIDTRKLTRRIRDVGAMRAGISTIDLDPSSLAARCRRYALGGSRPCGRDDRGGLRGRRGRRPGGLAREGLQVAVYDFGVKRNILRSLAASGVEATVVPASTPAADVLGGGSTASSSPTARATPPRRATALRRPPACSAGSRCSGTSPRPPAAELRAASKDARTRCRSAIEA